MSFGGTIEIAIDLINCGHLYWNFREVVLMYRSLYINCISLLNFIGNITKLKSVSLPFCILYFDLKFVAEITSGFILEEQMKSAVMVC